MFSTAITHRLALVLAVETMADADDIDYDALHVTVNSIAMCSWVFLACCMPSKLLMASSNILPEQEDAPLQFTHAKGLCINDLPNTAALKMTHFNWCQLHCLCRAFNLEGKLKPIKDKLPFPIRHEKNGHPCCY
jgi:hypothetical protein